MKPDDLCSYPRTHRVRLPAARKILLILLLAWGIPALACNYATPTPRRPGGASGAFEKTVSALRTVITPGIAITGSLPAPKQAIPSAAPGTPAHGATSTPGSIEGADEFTYYALAGDTLQGLAGRFGVEADQIGSPQSMPAQGLIEPGQAFSIPNRLGPTGPSSALLPDSEIIYSPSAAGFVVEDYVSRAGGFLSTYQEVVNGETLSGAEILHRTAMETSVNPLLLLAILEYRSHWVFGQPKDQKETDYPIGFEAGARGLYSELVFTAKQLNTGYYGWREGTFTTLKFPGGGKLRANPLLNAGSVALQSLFMLFYRQDAWLQTLYGPESFVSLHAWMFGDAWARAATVEPLFPAGLLPPALELPFLPGERWSLTSGPHSSWASGSPRGAIDFAPVTGEPACSVSRAWATAAAPGVVVRSDHGVLALDLDEDGKEQTGWVLVYLHLAESDRLPVGSRVNTDDPLGHPSCEGGPATGSHVHLARKYNGEWIAATGVFPMVLSGWRVEAGSQSYDGSLTKDGQVVTARPDGSHTSIIVR